MRNLHCTLVLAWQLLHSPVAGSTGFLSQAGWLLVVSSGAAMEHPGAMTCLLRTWETGWMVAELLQAACNVCNSRSSWACCEAHCISLCQTVPLLSKVLMPRRCSCCPWHWWDKD